MVGRFVLAEANHHRAPLGHGLACTNEATPRGESPEAIRPEPERHTARARERHARARRDTLAHLTDGHTAETPGTRSHRQFPSHVPGLWFRGRLQEHEWEISFPSCLPCMTRRPSAVRVGPTALPGPRYNSAYQLCDHFAQYRYRTGHYAARTGHCLPASTNPPRLVRPSRELLGLGWGGK